MFKQTSTIEIADKDKSLQIDMLIQCFLQNYFSFNSLDAQELGRISNDDLIVISKTPVSSLASISSRCRQIVATSSFGLNVGDCDPYIEVNLIYFSTKMKKKSYFIKYFYFDFTNYCC